MISPILERITNDCEYFRVKLSNLFFTTYSTYRSFYYFKNLQFIIILNQFYNHINKKTKIVELLIFKFRSNDYL